MTEEEVNTKADHWMKQAFHNVWNTSVKHKTTMRIAAYIYALGKIELGIKSRGHY